jgi:hypothetical protein
LAVVVLAAVQELAIQSVTTVDAVSGTILPVTTLVDDTSVAVADLEGLVKEKLAFCNQPCISCPLLPRCIVDIRIRCWHDGSRIMMLSRNARASQRAVTSTALTSVVHRRASELGRKFKFNAVEAPTRLPWLFVTTELAIFFLANALHHTAHDPQAAGCRRAMYHPSASMWIE